MLERIGFVGLGIMGSGMVANLVAKGHDVCVYSRRRDKAATLAGRLGITYAESIRELATRSSIFMLCVTDTPDVVEVIVGEEGVARHLPPRSLVIDCSTISPKSTELLAGLLRRRDIEFVDAPVSGGSEGAARGTLAVMVGGTDEAFARALPVLQSIGTNIAHVGAAGTGQSTKLLNQILVVVNMLAVSEALLFGQAAGLDLRKAISAVESGAAGSWMLSNRGKQVIDDYWHPGFTIDLQQKDLRLVLERANEMGLSLFATSEVQQLYAKLQREGKGDLGNHALIQALDAYTGFTARELTESA